MQRTQRMHRTRRGSSSSSGARPSQRDCRASVTGVAPRNVVCLTLERALVVLPAHGTQRRGMHVSRNCRTGFARTRSPRGERRLPGPRPRRGRASDSVRRHSSRRCVVSWRPAQPSRRPPGRSSPLGHRARHVPSSTRRQSMLPPCQLLPTHATVARSQCSPRVRCGQAIRGAASARRPGAAGPRARDARDVRAASSVRVRGFKRSAARRRSSRHRCSAPAALLALALRACALWVCARAVRLCCGLLLLLLLHPSSACRTGQARGGRRRLRRARRPGSGSGPHWPGTTHRSSPGGGTQRARDIGHRAAFIFRLQDAARPRPLLCDG